ncbi:MAG: cytochrome P450 [Saprospiraceae bacterium]
MQEKTQSCPFHAIHNIKEFDALDPAARENPWPYSDWLRSGADRRVYKLPQEDAIYLLHRYDDVKAALTDADTFSNKIIPTVKSPFFALTDGKDHQRIRSIIATFFTPSNLQKREAEVQNVVQTATENLLQKGRCELFENWAVPIPLGVLASMFGLPGHEASIAKYHHHAVAINRALFVTGGTGPRRSEEPTVAEKAAISFAIFKNIPRFIKLWKMVGNKGMAELKTMVQFARKDLATPRPNFEHIPAGLGPMLELMLLFLEKLKTHKNKDGTDGSDVIATLNFYHKKGDISQVEAMMAGAFILFAGHETVTSLLSNCFVHLARNPATFQELKAEPGLIENFVEEMLRFYTPVGRFLRRTTRAVELNGQSIPKDAIVILMLGAANSDAERFENGCLFDPGRKNARQHLAFGKGVHFCIGATLARMQAVAALKALVGRTSSIAVDETKPLKMVTDRDNGIFRYEELKVVVK